MNLVRSWKERSLATQFALAGGVVLLLAAVLIGNWVSSRIEGTVVRNTANATAQYMESFISPLSQELADGPSLSPGARRALDEIFSDTPLGERVMSYKIWSTDGLVVESSDPSVVGRRYEISDDLQGALAGNVMASFDDLSEVENAGENALGLPLLEVYSPIREVWSGKIIGATEFYETGTTLRNDLIDARRKSWLAVALVLTAIGGSLYAIVLQGSRTIDRQREKLTRQVTELDALSQRNTRLRMRVQEAAGRSSAMNDRTMRRVGADLHDGPAQHIGYAALRLDSLRTHYKNDPAATKELDAVEGAVRDAIREIRDIARGVALPEIEGRAPCEILRSVAEAHMARTGSHVELDCALPESLTLAPAIKICIYRIAQEGLNNSWRHAGGVGQEIGASLASGMLMVSVRDRGPGLPATQEPTPEAAKSHVDSGVGMGLGGLRDRVESLGGTFTVRSRTDAPGAEITMELELRTS